jgi:hypothetical protein
MALLPNRGLLLSTSRELDERQSREWQTVDNCDNVKLTCAKPNYLGLNCRAVVAFVRYCSLDGFSREDTVFTAPARMISYEPYSMQRFAVPKMRTFVSLSFISGSQNSPTFW